MRTPSTIRIVLVGLTTIYLILTVLVWGLPLCHVSLPDEVRQYLFWPIWGAFFLLPICCAIEVERQPGLVRAILIILAVSYLVPIASAIQTTLR